MKETGNDFHLYIVHVTVLYVCVMVVVRGGQRGGGSEEEGGQRRGGVLCV